jgi:hypothetical protein
MGAVPFVEVAEDGGVELVIAQPVELRTRWQLKQAHLRVWMPLTKLAHRWRDEIIEHWCEEAEAERAPCFAKLLAQLLYACFSIADDLLQ